MSCSLSLSLMFFANIVLVILTSTTVCRGSRRASNRTLCLFRIQGEDRREMMTTTTTKEKSMRDIYGILWKAFNGRMGYTGV